MWKSRGEELSLSPSWWKGSGHNVLTQNKLHLKIKDVRRGDITKNEEEPRNEEEDGTPKIEEQGRFLYLLYLHSR